ncbi:YdiU family protein [Polynucleobacter paludilacus]|uniref:protein adenylyltransferase SelO n=1 Tax=Polynucleobacter paludilacus TaxID=1855895 RepID=UPI001BFED83F|nr:YdiU family protein [Polynucleobacter paludilacus]QWD87814.1 YdiU family protein [Polynucleobacter paludilacus]
MAFLLQGDDVLHQVNPSPLPDPYWVAFSSSAAKLINIPLGRAQLPSDPKWLEVLAGNRLDLDDKTFDRPIATAYSGHQFGVWAGHLGDGRAILLGEINGQELQLKGAGKTRYSRMGDGRAVLRSSIREFLCSEAMHGLGIPSSRALAVVGSNQAVRRETLETAAVCSRLAPSFIRIGHFEHYAALQKVERLQELADYLIDHFYPECRAAKEPYLELFKAISARSADLVAQWQAVGFCHGVLNTDNISALGLTIDYGPFGFLDQFQIDHVCNHSDSGGRYAYHRQPQIMHWNMACLASAMCPLLEINHPSETAQALLRSALEEFPKLYAGRWQGLFRAKLGLQTVEFEDISLIERLLQVMHDARVDYTFFFRKLANYDSILLKPPKEARDLFNHLAVIDEWFRDYGLRLQSENSVDAERKMLMNACNPKFILRNHLAQDAIEKAQIQDYSEVSKLLAILENPFDEQENNEAYANPPPSEYRPVEVSCSS